MRVWRIEHKVSGLGPYQHGNDIALAAPRTICNNPHAERPAPEYDGIQHCRGHRFGFASFDRLRAWFPDSCRMALQEEGFRLVVYEVPSSAVRLGRKQVAFLHKEARRIIP